MQFRGGSSEALPSPAEIRGRFAHRFRDTFAVELLLSGVPLERVSVLLGHQSIRITERYYAPWTKSLQEQLEADLQRARMEDPIAPMQTKGTPQVHRCTKQSGKTNGCLYSSIEWCRRGESYCLRGLKTTKLLILHNAKYAKDAQIAEVGYTAGTQGGVTVGGPK